MRPEPTASSTERSLSTPTTSIPRSANESASGRPIRPSPTIAVLIATPSAYPALFEVADARCSACGAEAPPLPQRCRQAGHECECRDEEPRFAEITARFTAQPVTEVASMQEL